MSRVAARIKIGSRVMWSEEYEYYSASMIFTGTVRAVVDTGIEVIDIALYSLEFSEGIQGEIKFQINARGILPFDKVVSLDDVRYKQ